MVGIRRRLQVAVCTLQASCAGFGVVSCPLNFHSSTKNKEPETKNSSKAAKTPNPQQCNPQRCRRQHATLQPATHLIRHPPFFKTRNPGPYSRRPWEEESVTPAMRTLAPGEGSEPVCPENRRCKRRY